MCLLFGHHRAGQNPNILQKRSFATLPSQCRTPRKLSSGFNKQGETERDTDGQTDRHIEIETDRQTERDIQRETERALSSITSTFPVLPGH